MAAPSLQHHFRILASTAFFAVAMVDFITLADTVGAGEIDMVRFGSLDAGAEQFLTVGAKFAPAPLDRDGFVALASLGVGRRDEERVPGVARQRYTAGAAVVVGY